MEELPETLKAEIEALDSLAARALKRRYAAIVSDMPNCALSSVLRRDDVVGLVTGGDAASASAVSVVEHALAGHEEVVSVHQPDHLFPANLCMQAVTLPK